MKSKKKVLVLGHVDHGKNALMGALQNHDVEIVDSAEELRKHVEQQGSLTITGDLDRVKDLAIPRLDFRRPETRAERRKRERDASKKRRGY